MERESIFDAKASHWDQSQRRQSVAEAAIDFFAQTWRQYSSHSPRLLDVGAGTGLISVGMADLAQRVTALDNSEGMLQQLQEKIQAKGLHHIHPLKQDILVDPLPPQESYDMVVMGMALHHIKDLITLFARLKERLTKPGIIAISDLMTEDGSFHDDNHGVAHFGLSQKQLQEAFELNDMKLCQYSTIFTFYKERNGKQQSYPIFGAYGTL